MRKVDLLMFVSLDGYFEAPGHDISWAQNDGDAFTAEGSQQVDTLLFGRKTYEGMKAYWPTQQAAESTPEIAKFMNEKRKVVASHASFEPGWNNVTVISGDVVAEVKKLKEQPGNNILIIGSNTLCVSLMPGGLIDEFQILVNPVVLGEGTSLFRGLPEKTELTLTNTRKLKSGTMMLTYEPVKR